MLTFLIVQGDKAILGKFLTLDTFGIYNVGFFLAGFPTLLGSAVVGRILIPIYRNSPPDASPENFRKLRRMRFAFSAGLMAMVAFMAHVGVPIVNFLYDDRYTQAGPILVAIAMSQLVNVIGLTYDQAALAAGDSRRFFYLTVARALLQTGAFATGIILGGLQGALAGLLVAALLTYPGIALLARRLRVWDPLHDAVFAAVAVVVGSLAIWRYWDEMLALAQLGQR
jgi:O-antigen/teichoic acid export membrane protein